MYFERNEIRKVKNHIARHANEIGVLMLDEDYSMYDGALNSILATHGRQYEQGEQITSEHYNALMDWAKSAVINSANSIIKNAKSGNFPEKPINDPVEHLLTLTDYFYVMGMQRLGCPNMQLFVFNNDVKTVIQEYALKMDKVLHKYDISTEREFTKQRGKNAKELEKRFSDHIVAINKQDNKPQHVGELIAEYQALKERQNRHIGIWRFFHSKENQARNELLSKMEDAIKTTMNKILPQNKSENLDALNPSEIARIFADARIRGSVEVAGVNRFGENAKKIFGYLDAETKNNLMNNKESDLSNYKEPMGNDKTFVEDINGKKEEISHSINENRVFEKDNIIANDDGFQLLSD